MKHNSSLRIAKRGDLILAHYTTFTDTKPEYDINPILKDNFLLLEVDGAYNSPETYYSAGKIVEMGCGPWDSRLFVV